MSPFFNRLYKISHDNLLSRQNNYSGAYLVCRVGDHLDPAVRKRDVILSCCDVGVTGLSVTKVVVVVVPYRILPVVLNLTLPKCQKRVVAIVV